MTAPILELRGVNKSFGMVHVLRDVDFAVYPGEVTALVGDNGAGKSTLVKAIAGMFIGLLVSCVGGGKFGFMGSAAQRWVELTTAGREALRPG